MATEANLSQMAAMILQALDGGHEYRSMKGELQ